MGRQIHRAQQCWAEYIAPCKVVINPCIWSQVAEIEGEMQKRYDVEWRNVDAASKRDDARRLLSEVRLESCLDRGGQAPGGLNVKSSASETNVDGIIL